MNQLRIVGGQWRSRRLTFTEAPGLRPTPDRVRETLFNWLGQDLQGWNCLDLFAGSGALGFEAASRGAARVTLLEQNPQVFAALRHNAEVLGGPALHCVRGDAQRFLAKCTERFDLILLDPPFRMDWLPKLEKEMPRLVAEGGAIYVEAEHELTEFAGCKAVKKGCAGQVHYHLFRGDSI